MRRFGVTAALSGVIDDRLLDMVIDQATGGKMRLIESDAAGEDTCIDSRAVHYPHVCSEICKQRIEQIVWIAALVELHRYSTVLAFEEFGRRVVLLEINDHGVAPTNAVRPHQGCSRAASGASHK